MTRIKYLLFLILTLSLTCTLLAGASIAMGARTVGDVLLLAEHRHTDIAFSQLDVQTGIQLPVTRLPSGVGGRWSNERDQMAIISTLPGQMFLSAANLLTGETVRHTVPFDEFGSPSMWWSPDERWMVVFGIGLRYIVDVQTGDVTHLPVGLVGGVWFADSVRYAYPDQVDDVTGLRILDVRTMDSRFMPGENAAAWLDLSLAPDEDRLLFRAFDERDRLYAFDLETGDITPVAPVMTPVYWSPDGSAFGFMTDHDLFAIMLRDGTIQEYSIPFSHNYDLTRWSPDSQRVIVNSGGRLTLIDVQQAEATILHYGEATDLLWFDDGVRLGFYADDSHIMVLDTQTGEMLARHAIAGNEVFWSPDGERAVILQRLSQERRVFYLLDVDSGARRRLDVPTGRYIGAVWLPGGGGS